MQSAALKMEEEMPAKKSTKGTGSKLKKVSLSKVKPLTRAGGEKLKYE